MQEWEQFLQQIECEIGIRTVHKWLRSLKILRFDACNLYLEAKDSFQVLWFEEHIRSFALTRFVNGNHSRINIHLSTANQVSQQYKNRNQTKGNNDLSSTSFQLHFDELDPLALFQNFIVSEENQLTYRILSDAAGLSNERTNSLEFYNPIYVYGPSGSGKTHLLMSMAHCFRAKGIKSLYVRAELFTDHVVTAIRAGQMSTFRQAYRNADILIVDDIHVFSKKGATQEEFFHTFNTLHLEGKQIILGANCPPKDLQLIEPRLVSRFEWGIVLALKPPREIDLPEILKAKAHALEFVLPSKIADFLIKSFPSNSKALIKAFEALVLRLHLDSAHSIHQLSLNAVKVLLSDLLSEELKAALTPSKIIQSVSEYYGIRSEDILGKAQTRDCALPRQIAMHLCRVKLKLPFMKIGDIFSRDHSTVMASVKHVQKSLEEEDIDITGSFNAILKKLQT